MVRDTVHSKRQRPALEYRKDRIDPSPHFFCSSSRGKSEQTSLHIYLFGHSLDEYFTRFVVSPSLICSFVTFYFIFNFHRSHGGARALCHARGGNVARTLGRGHTERLPLPEAPTPTFCRACLLFIFNARRPSAVSSLSFGRPKPSQRSFRHIHSLKTNRIPGRLPP